MIVGLSGLGATGAVADPVCAASPPVAGAVVRGPVLQVQSAEVFCVALGETKTAWVAVTLSQPAASRGALMAAAFGKNAECRVGSDGRAVCTVEDADLSAVLSSTQVRQTAADWR